MSVNTPARRANPSRGRPRRRNTGRDQRHAAAAARAAQVKAFDTTTSQFGSYGLPDVLVASLGVDGIVEPTPVQAAVLPDALAGHDVLGRARTGSGKTLAFGLPTLRRLAGARSAPYRPRALIVLPTRELAMQVRTALEPLADAVGLKMATVYGGSPYDRQINRLRSGADVVVATPGRLKDLRERGACQLDDVEIVTLDEADHLCDLGFYPEIDELLRHTPAGGQRLLLSATLDGDVDRLVRDHLNEPVRHEIDPDQSSITTMDHHVLLVGPQNRLDVATELVRANPRSIVFTRTKAGATSLASSLDEAGVPAVDLHGDLSQRARERNLDRFRTGRAQVVVATDVAARGIHVDNVGLVVHYDPAGEAKSYLHRSGRTARAGASGTVVTVAMPRQARTMADLHRAAGVEAKQIDARRLDGVELTASALAEAPAMPALTGKNDRNRPGRGAPKGRPRNRSGSGRKNAPRRAPQHR